MRAKLGCLLLAASVAGCGAQAAPRSSGGGGGREAGAVVPPPTVNPNTGPCWCYSGPQEDTIRTWAEADRNAGYSYEAELQAAMDACLNTSWVDCSLTCGTEIVRQVYGR